MRKPRRQNVPTGTIPAPQFGTDAQQVLAAVMAMLQSGQVATPQNVPPQAEPRKRNAGSSNVGFSYTQERNGVGIKFSAKPTEEMRKELKDSGFRFSGSTSSWYPTSKASQLPARYRRA